jgi:hypothetical protein
LPNIKFAEDTSLLDYQHKMTPIPNYQSLNKNNARMAKAHNFLLQSRQTSLQQLSLFLQQQLDLYKKMVIQAKKEQ